MNQDLAHTWAKVVKEVLIGQELVRVEAPSWRWPETRIAQRFERVEVMEWRMDSTLSITDNQGTMCNITEMHLNPERRTIHAKSATEDYGVIRISWTLMDRSSQTYQMMLDAEAAIKLALFRQPPAQPVKPQEKQDDDDMVLRKAEPEEGGRSGERNED
jgi:hypothetical protein